MKNTERQGQRPDYSSYVNVQSPEEGLYKALKDYYEGKLTGDDLRHLADMYINSFPPFQFFYGRSGSDEYFRNAVMSAGSPEGFAKTELFRSIMTNEGVIDRFKKASPNVIGLTGNNDYPPYWPQEYRVKTAPVSQAETDGWEVTKAPERAKGWRTKLKELFGMD